MLGLKKNAIPHTDDMSHTHFMAKNTYLKLYARVPTKVGQSHRALSRYNTPLPPIRLYCW